MEETEFSDQKTIRVNLSYLGDGSGIIKETKPGVFSGGVTPPKLNQEIHFQVLPEYPDETGILNPVGEVFKGALQINIHGTAGAYQALGRYLLALAELDCTANPDYHAHHHLVSEDHAAQFHVILRKKPSE